MSATTINGLDLYKCTIITTTCYMSSIFCIYPASSKYHSHIQNIQTFIWLDKRSITTVFPILLIVFISMSGQHKKLKIREHIYFCTVCVFILIVFLLCAKPNWTLNAILPVEVQVSYQSIELTQYHHHVPNPSWPCHLRLSVLPRALPEVWNSVVRLLYKNR
jgi:hypothetical protein